MGFTKGWVFPIFSTGFLSLSLIAGLTLATTAPRAHAETQEECQRHVVHAEHELHEAIERHGRDSRQADHKRHDLHEAREHCWQEHHRWWDEREHRWHDQRDWDDRDHDRY